MKLLEELDHEQKRKSNDAGCRTVSQVQQAPPSKEVREALMALQAQAIELADGLNRLTARAQVDYAIKAQGVLKQLHQRAYAVTVEDPDLPRFCLAFECVGNRNLLLKAQTTAHRETMMAGLTELGLDFIVDGTSGFRYGIVVKSVVPVTIIVTPTPDGRAIRLDTRNLNRLGRELFSVLPSVVPEDFVGELGKLILRRQNRFSEMTGNQVSSEALARLRERLQDRRHSVQGEDVDTTSHPARTQRPSSAERSVKAGGLPRRAPILVNEHTQAEGMVDWNNTSGLAQFTPGQDKDKSKAVADAGPTGNGPSKPVEHGQPPPGYAWVITTDVYEEEPDESIAKRGPKGSSLSFPTSRVINDGEDFQLLGADGEMRYCGMILGSYRGEEPLQEFGRKHGCSAIAFRRDVQWKSVPASVGKR